MTNLPVALALALVGCGAFNYTEPDGPRHAGAFTPRVPPDGTIRVATFNVRYAEQIDLAIAELEAEGPFDVVLLQEMDADGTRRIAEALAMSWVYYPASIHGERDFGNAVLSSLAIVEDHKVLLPHRAPFDGRARVAVIALLDGPAGPLFVASVHDETFLLPLAARLEQAQAILDDAALRYPDLPGIVAGDFNTAEPEAVDATVALHRLEGYARAAPPTGAPTASSPLGEVTLDLVFTRGLDVEARGVGRASEASDHRVVWVQLGGL